MKYIYLFKFIAYGAIASYSYSQSSKFTLAWIFLAGLMAIFHIQILIEDKK